MSIVKENITVDGFIYAGTIGASLFLIPTEQQNDTLVVLLKIGCCGCVASMILKNGLNLIGRKTNALVLTKNRLRVTSIMNIGAIIAFPEVSSMFTFWTLGWQIGDIIYSNLMCDE